MGDGVERFVTGVAAVESAECVAEGPYVHVYHGTMVDIDEPVRFLTLAPGQDDEAVAEAFAETARNWQTAGTHPNIVTVFDNGTTPRPWVATRRVDEGRPLGEARSTLSPADIRTIVEGVGEALRAARLYNARLPVLEPDSVHVFPASTGDGVTARIEDWGLARACRLAAGETPVSPSVPPERLDGEPRTERSSVYEFGVLSYFLLTGDLPVQPGEDLLDRVRSTAVTPPSECVDLLPEAVDRPVLEALSTDPGERQGSTQALKRDLLDGLPDAGGATSTGTQPVLNAGAAAGEADSDTAERPADSDGQLRERLTGAGSALSRTTALGVAGVVAVLLLGGMLFAGGALPGMGGGGGGGGSPAFDVEVTGTNGPVTAGDTLKLTVAVENIGDGGTGSLEVRANGLGTEAVDMSLGDGESTTETVTIETEAGDAGEYAVTLDTGDDSESETVTVKEPTPARLEVTITGTNAPVVAGETLTVDADIQNTGEQAGERVVSMSIGEAGNDSKTVALAGGETTERTFTAETGPGDIGEQIVLVSASNTDSLTVPVEAPEGTSPPTFEVAIGGTNAPVEPGAALSVEAVVTNTGDFEGTQPVTLETDGLGTDSTTLTLTSGASAEQTFTVETGAGDEGQYTVTVTSEDDTATATVGVDTGGESAPGTVEVNGTSVDGPVAAGDPLEVTATLANTGETTVTQTVSLDAGGLGTDTTTVSLAGGQTTEQTLSVETGPGDAGEYTATVASEDDTATATVAVEEADGGGSEPPSFAVQINSTNSPVTAGETLAVTAAVENTGDTEGSATVTLSVDGVGNDSTTVTLDGGATTTETLGLETPVPGEYTATVATDGDTASTAVTVQESGSDNPDPGAAVFEADITETSAPVTAGETISVETTIENTGVASGTQTVTLSVGGLGGASGSISLAAGASTTETFSVETSPDDVGEYTATVATDNDTATESVLVETGETAAAAFQVVEQETNAPVVAGETVTVAVTIQNTGDGFGVQTVLFDAGPLGQDSVTVSLAAGASTTETVGVATSPGDAGQYTATVSTENDTASTAVAVETPATPTPAFDVAIAGTNAPVVAGGTLTVTAAVENTGTGSDTQTLQLDAGALGTDAVDVTLAAGESTQQTLGVGTAAGDAGSYTATVSTENDTASTSVSVEAPSTPTPTFDVAVAGTNAPVVAGETLAVDVAIENTGEADGTQTVTLGVSGLGEDSTAVSLAAGASTTETLTVGTSPGDAGEYTATVASQNETVITGIEVEQPAPNFEVTITGATDPVVAGETLTVDADIQNTGNAPDTQNVTFLIDGSQAGSRTVQLDDGAGTTESFSTGTDPGSAGSTLTATVSTDDDQGSVDVDVVADTEILADLGDASGTVGDTVQVDLDVTSLSGGDATIGAYGIEFTYDETVLKATDVVDGAFSTGATSIGGGTVAASGFGQSVDTPATPALTFEFEIVGAGTSSLSLDAGGSSIKDTSGSGYDVVFNDGSVSAQESTGQGDARADVSPGPETDKPTSDRWRAR